MSAIHVFAILAHLLPRMREIYNHSSTPTLQFDSKFHFVKPDLLQDMNFWLLDHVLGHLARLDCKP